MNNLYKITLLTAFFIFLAQCSSQDKIMVNHPTKDETVETFNLEVCAPLAASDEDLETEAKTFGCREPRLLHSHIVGIDEFRKNVRHEMKYCCVFSCLFECKGK